MSDSIDGDQRAAKRHRTEDTPTARNDSGAAANSTTGDPTAHEFGGHGRVTVLLSGAGGEMEGVNWGQILVATLEQRPFYNIVTTGTPPDLTYSWPGVNGRPVRCLIYAADNVLLSAKSNWQAQGGLSTTFNALGASSTRYDIGVTGSSRPQVSLHWPGLEYTETVNLANEQDPTGTSSVFFTQTLAILPDTSTRWFAYFTYDFFFYLPIVLTPGTFDIKALGNPKTNQAMMEEERKRRQIKYTKAMTLPIID